VACHGVVRFGYHLKILRGIIRMVSHIASHIVSEAYIVTGLEISVSFIHSFIGGHLCSPVVRTIYNKPIYYYYSRSRTTGLWDYMAIASVGFNPWIGDRLIGRCLEPEPVTAHGIV